MRLPNDAGLLDIWEQGHGRGPVARTKLLLAAALPAVDEAGRAALRVSAADVALLQLRRAIFGPKLPAETACRRCAELLVFELDAGTLIDGLASSSKRDAAVPDSIRFREPTVADLAALAGISHADTAQSRLASQCLLEIEHAEPPSDAEIAQIDTLYGQGVIRLRMDCAACGQAWNEDFDIAAYLWEEIAQRAQARLDEIHVLATSYGWSEPQILALSDARRAAYLQRCGA
ncbi:MAG: hypothetical protein ACREC0_05440 [Methylocella sp.]